jgi:uncharacterized membrane protein HdeD (DUF308 family)
MTPPPILVGLQELKHKWGWFFAFGLLLIVVGMIALSAQVVTTLLTVFFFGCLLLGTGVVEAMSSFVARKWSGFFLHLLAGILDIVIGIYFISHPAAAAETLTLVIAAFFVVGGVYRTIAAIALQFPHWGWSALSGVVTMILGLMLWSAWPWSGFWFIGMCIAIELIFRGASWLTFSLRARSLPVA